MQFCAVSYQVKFPQKSILYKFRSAKAKELITLVQTPISKAALDDVVQYKELTQWFVHHMPYK